jgi:hypothetical protein
MTKCIDEKSGMEGKCHCWQGSDVLHHDRSLIEWIKKSKIIESRMDLSSDTEAAATSMLLSNRK